MRWLGIKFEPRDIWVGVYWTRERHLGDWPDPEPWWITELTFYICLVPMIVAKIRVYHSPSLEK